MASQRRQFTRELKVEAVRLVFERRVSDSQAARDLGFTSMCSATAFESSAPILRMPSQAMGSRSRRTRRLPAETGSRSPEDGTQHPEKSRGLLREGVDVKFGFIAKHRGIWPVDVHCEALSDRSIRD